MDARKGAFIKVRQGPKQTEETPNTGSPSTDKWTLLYLTHTTKVIEKTAGASWLISMFFLISNVFKKNCTWVLSEEECTPLIVSYSSWFSILYNSQAYSLMLATYMISKGIWICESFHLIHTEFVFRQIWKTYYMLGTIGDIKRMTKLFIHSLIHSFNQCPVGCLPFAKF